MKITEFRVENYKSFADSNWLPIGSRTIIVGQNNAGKTALLEAIAGRSANQPHETPHTRPNAAPANQQVITSYRLRVDAEDIETAMAFASSRGQWLAIPTTTPYPERFQPDALFLEFTKQFTAPKTAVIRNGATQADTEYMPPSFRKTTQFTNVKSTHGSREFAGGSFPSSQGNAVQDLTYWSLERQRAKQMILWAHRSAVPATCPVTAPPDELDATSTNLPAVLQQLKGRNDAGWNRYMAAVRRVLPGVQSIKPQTEQGIRVVIKLAEYPPEDELLYLDRSLEHCGSGVGNILALLYAIVADNDPKLIILGEPNNFLHPLATSELARIIIQNPKHQYIISTHSPELLARLDPDSILLVEKPFNPKTKSFESVVRPLSANDWQSYTEVSRALGVGVGDVMGRRCVLWVEGECEEVIFPMLLEREHVNMLGVATCKLASTADFETNPNRTSQIIDCVQRGIGMLPGLLGFIVDSEGRSDGQKRSIADDIRKTKGDVVYFLQRPMIENYFFDLEAIATLVQSETGRPCNSADVATKLKAIMDDREGVVTKKLLMNSMRDKDSDLSLHAALERRFHGSNLLHVLLSQLTDSAIDYKSHKRTYSVKLVQILIERQSAELKVLSFEVASTVSKWQEKAHVE